MPLFQSLCRQDSFAAVFQVEEILDFSNTVRFTPDQVMKSLNDLDPRYQDHISLHHLPNFDLDGDSYLNYDELVEGSDPQHAQSIPYPPEVMARLPMVRWIRFR
ncbi:MAG: hypothetical protein H7A32_02405 [Deltaproteobacteria bacterium]|nr:hypothetical protein [Deltaproteobacteria bacterium]